ncbi:MAG: glycoside hydrolase family 43 protein [Puniceicoccales bacterium]|jgi:GH43 family beta-xylosidase|nr:glycoside hydrolase family 43 protein [Puniceicoccales bacterium]
MSAAAVNRLSFLSLLTPLLALPALPATRAAGAATGTAAGDKKLIPTEDICVRDPFIYADPKSGTYILYAQSENRRGSGYKGVEAYTSTDLKNWTPPRRVLDLGALGIANRATWAPEMHAYKGAFYLFTTLTFAGGAAPAKSARVRHGRGTWIFKSSSPLGPFKPLKDGPHTPPKWMALDGTLHVERDGTPWFVFCHEWVQVGDGTIEAVPLKRDLSDVAGEPVTLFRASVAPRVRPNLRVTDGPFLYRSPKSGALLMIWSTFLTGSDYCVLVAKSESGTVLGPWRGHTPLYTKHGGHGMLFRTFEGKPPAAGLAPGQLTLSLHQPNSPGGKERLRLFPIRDTGDGLELAS